MKEAEEAHSLTRTRDAYLGTQLLHIPFWAIFNMLPFFLYKDLGATPFQIALLVSLKPAAALFSPYWSSWIHKRPDRLLSNLVLANILRFLPFLCFPWISNSWFFVFSFGFHMIFARGVIPAWMEVLRLTVKGKAKERLFALGSAIDYIGCGLTPLAFGFLLDNSPEAWRWLFFAFAVLGISTTPLLQRISLKHPPVTETETTSLSLFLSAPWKRSYKLLTTRIDFTRFHIGFMLGGAGLMIMHPILPNFFVDVLHLSYSEILTALTLCKGIGFALSSPLWVKSFEKGDIYRLSSFAMATATLFPLLLLFTTVYSHALILAYLIYGVMQGGSKLSWNLSGPHFARNEDSTSFSTANVISVGVRGLIAPLIGNLLYLATNSVVVLLAGFIVCLFATERMRSYSSLYEAQLEPSAEA